MIHPIYFLNACYSSYCDSFIFACASFWPRNSYSKCLKSIFQWNGRLFGDFNYFVWLNSAPFVQSSASSHLDLPDCLHPINIVHAAQIICFTQMCVTIQKKYATCPIWCAVLRQAQKHTHPQTHIQCHKAHLVPQLGPLSGSQPFTRSHPSAQTTHDRYTHPHKHSSHPQIFSQTPKTQVHTLLQKFTSKPNTLTMSWTSGGGFISFLIIIIIILF